MAPKKTSPGSPRKSKSPKSVDRSRASTSKSQTSSIESEPEALTAYMQLPKHVEQDFTGILGPKKADQKRGESVSAFLTEHAPEDRLKDGLLDNLKHRVFFLDNVESRKKRYNLKRSRRQKLTSKEKKKLKLFQIPKEQKYESFIPLFYLWKDYMKDVIGFDKIKATNHSESQQKLLKADYHGAMVTVTQSKTPSLIGQTGIIIQETKNVFKLVSRDDKLKIIPKQNSVFTMEIEGHVISIQGNQFCYTSAERVHRKFKFKPLTDF